MASTLPHAAHGDELVVTKIDPKYEGKGENRHIVGAQFRALMLFDGCAHATITVKGLNPATFPTPDVLAEHNMKLAFLKIRFTDLVITFSGGDYGSIIYRGTASSAEIIHSK